MMSVPTVRLNKLKLYRIIVYKRDGKWKIENMYYKALCSLFLRLHEKGYKSFLLKL
jgi:hypothetical protein